MKNLAPCPFCGSTQLSSLELDLNSWSIECMNCQATGPLKVSEEAAVISWERAYEILKNRDDLVGNLLIRYI